MFLRKLLVSTNVIIGGILLVGAALFVWMGAGTYGTPVSGSDFFNTTLMGVLVFGPMALLPCTFLEISKPRWGGFLLCFSALVCTFCIWMNNQYDWGFAASNFWLATASISIPLFIVGCLYIKSAKDSVPRHIVQDDGEPAQIEPTHDEPTDGESVERDPILVVNEKTVESKRMYIG